MYKKTALFSLLCVCISIGISIWAWQGLPDLERYPVHWNASGEPDRYGGRGAALFNLALMPVICLCVALLFYFIPKFEPMQKNLLASGRAYTLMWSALMVLFVAITFTIAQSYLQLSNGKQKLDFINYFPFAFGAFYILLGNIMGKIRQNFMFGIRTPWTLSSDLSWEKTHRIAGRLFVLSGIIGITAGFLAPADIAIITIIGLCLATVLFSLVYSYRAWKSDPDKRT